MHEYSILQALLARVGEEAARVGAHAVRRVEVRIGEQAGVDIGLFETAWETLGKEGLTAAASLVVVPAPVVWACRACAAPVPTGGPLRCPACGQPARMLSGDEIILERLEMEVSDV